MLWIKNCVKLDQPQANGGDYTVLSGVLLTRNIVIDAEINAVRYVKRTGTNSGGPNSLGAVSQSNA
jgi:hypothetical protein